MERSHRFTRAAWFLAVASTAVLLSLCGCSRDRALPHPSQTLGPERTAGAIGGAALASQEQVGETPPAGLVSVSFQGSDLTLWPYTGNSFDGTASDPVNLLFAGTTDPVRIRAALLGLDGDRTAFGFPPAYPFNAKWSDAVGDVQTTYAEGEGWEGSVIQLQLGVYAPIRAHLRLFRTGVAFGSEGTWTVGAAHFEVLIPGTADHQVLSWELAEQLVMVDLIRSGLLDPSTPYQPTDAITQVPSFRTIPEVIYDGLPEDLKVAIGGPPGSVSGPVPIANDGRATILHVTGEPAPQTGTFADQFTLQYEQMIPKPLCSDGPLDWVLVSGPVDLSRDATVDDSGRYQYHERVSGRLTITPVDVTVSPPVPAGESYEAEIGDLQQGSIDPSAAAALAEARRLAPQPGGTELLMTRLRVASNGADSYRALMRCP